MTDEMEIEEPETESGPRGKSALDRRGVLKGTVGGATAAGAFVPTVRVAPSDPTLSAGPTVKTITVWPDKGGLVAGDLVLRIHSPFDGGCVPTHPANAPGITTLNVVGTSSSACGPGVTALAIAANLAANMTLPPGWTAGSGDGGDGKGLVTISAPHRGVAIQCSLEARTTGEFGTGGCPLLIGPAVTNVCEGTGGNERAAWTKGYQFT